MFNEGIGLEAIEYTTLKNKYGVRRPTELFNPRLVSIMDFPGLPFNGVLHYIGDGVGDLGPTHDSLFLRRYNVPAMVDHVLEYNSSKGNPRKVATNLNSLVRDYHKRNFRLRPMRKWLSVVNDKRTPIVVNYAIASYGVKYINNFMVGYNRWYNTMSTVWSKVNELATTYNRHHFIYFQLPTDMPSIGDLRRAETMVDEDNVPKSNDGSGLENFTVIENNNNIDIFGSMGIESFKNEVNKNIGLENFVEEYQGAISDLPSGVGLEALTRSVLEVFSSNEMLNILDLWMWMGSDREKSLMNRLTKDALRNVNFVFVEGSKVSILNLGLLDSVRAPTSVVGKNQMPPKQAQRLIMRFLDKVFTLRSQKNELDTYLDEENDEPSDVIETETIDIHGNTVEDTSQVVPDLTVAEDDFTDDMLLELQKEELDDIPSKLNELQSLQKSIDTDTITNEVIRKLLVDEASPEDITKQEIDTLADAGSISAQDYRRLNKAAETYKSLPNPYGGEGTLENFITIPRELEILPKECKLPINPVGLLDKSMLGNTLQVMQKQYLKKVMKRHVSSCIVNALQRQGVTIQNYRIEPVRTLLDEYDIHVISVIPTKGSPSTVRLKIPHIQDDGIYLANGIKNRLNPQRTDKPIRKISSREVMISSYYGKLSVTKAERANFNADKWILGNIAKRGMDPEDLSITDLRVYKSFRFDLKLPPIYQLLATRFSEFTSPTKLLTLMQESTTFYINYDKLNKNFTPEEITQWNNDKQVLIGKVNNGMPIVVDYDNAFYLCKPEGLEPIGTIEDILGLDIEKRPVEILELDVFSVQFPLGLVLGYYVGIDNLIKLLKPPHRRVERLGRERMDVGPNEFAVVFADQYLVFEKGNKFNEFIFGGFTRWPKDLQRYSINLFNKPEVYTALFERNGISARYIRELKQIFSMFIDPITKTNLELMNAPTEMFKVFLYAARLLTTMEYPAASDARESRDRGYERVAGLAYTELSKAMRTFKSKTSPNARFEINPMSVWMGTIQDAANSLVEDSNPIHNMKESEIVVFGGTGGRGQRSMQGNHRAFDETQIGTTSEATKDSGKVATIVYTSQDPKYNSIYGTTDQYDPETDGPARLFSGSVMLAPASDREDMKRSGFTSIQNSQTIACVGAQKMPLCTGDEITVAHRVGKLFASVAEDNGKVIHIDEKHIVIQYNNGEQLIRKLGREFGVMAGMSTAHELVTDLKIGDAVKLGDVVVWNKMFFNRDRFNPKQTTFKYATLARVALVEKDVTFEDASLISDSLAKRLEADLPQVKVLRIRFDQDIRNLVKLGDTLNVDSIICTIENPFGSGASSIYNEESRKTLSEIETLTPKAGYEGRVEQIKVLYNGEIEDMSESLQRLVKASDKALSKTYELEGNNKVSGKVMPGYRVNNQAIATDEAIVFIHITNRVGMSGGDKLAFANQMKSIVSYHVTTGVFETEDGTPLDAGFSYLSFLKRIVESGMLMGTTNTLAVEATRKIVSAYRGKS
jgi:hypothetical protein